MEPNHYHPIALDLLISIIQTIHLHLPPPLRYTHFLPFHLKYQKKTYENVN